jgi:hypothetical protein
MRRLRVVSYANVTATLALVVALGGTSYAALHISTADIENGAVTSSKLANKAVVAAKVGNAAVTAVALAPKAVTPAAVNGANRFPIKVNDAKTLNGVASSDYVHGSGAAGVYSVTSASPKTVISVPPFGKLGIGCEKGQGFARFTNTSGQPIVVAIDSSSASFRSATVSSGAAINGPTSTKPQLQTWSIRRGDATKNTVVTMWITFVKGANNSCVGTAQALKG